MQAPCRNTKLALCLAAIGLPLVSCSTHKTPAFRVTDARLASQTDENAVILVTIEGENPNPDPLPLYAVEYSARLEGDPVMSGVERAPERTLPRFGTAAFTVPVVVANDRLTGPAAMLAIDGAVVYQLPGTIAQVFFDNDIRRPRVRITGEQSVYLDATVPAPASLTP